eukprot:gene853-925_t
MEGILIDKEKSEVSGDPILPSLESVPIEEAVPIHPHQPHNSDFFGTGEPIVLEPTVTEPVDAPIIVEEETENDEEGPQSSFENIIPIANLKHGFAVVSEIVEKTAAKVQETATEVYESENFQAARKKTSEIITPVWEQTKATAAVAAEKTREVAAPVWEQTKVTASVAAEKTQEGINIAAQRMRPAMQQFGRQLSDATLSSWKFLSAAALSAADYTSKLASDVLGDEEQFANAQNVPPETPSDPSNPFNSKPTVV